MNRIDPDIPASDPQWFRAPNRREHWIAAGLSMGFALFFFILFYVERGWWFRWVILGLGFFSLLQVIRHARGAIRS
jgi:hypothetical protein